MVDYDPMVDSLLRISTGIQRGFDAERPDRISSVLPGEYWHGIQSVGLTDAFSDPCSRKSSSLVRHITDGLYCILVCRAKKNGKISCPGLISMYYFIFLLDKLSEIHAEKQVRMTAPETRTKDFPLGSAVKVDRLSWNPNSFRSTEKEYNFSRLM